jgi:type VI protein secretion system component Hcp
MPIYLKIEGVQGPATGNFRGWFDIDSVQLGQTKISGMSRTPEVPNVRDIVATRHSDHGSADLCRLAMFGEPKKMVIDFTRADVTSSVYFEIVLDAALIAGFSISSNAPGRAAPLETITLNFTGMHFEHLASTVPVPSARP